MTTAASATRVSVLTRLRDLRDWAIFIRDSLKSDQPFEPGTRELIIAYMGEPFLREFDADSQRVIEKLDQMIDRIVSSAKPLEQLQPPLS
jgi:hypothetical protein